MMGGPLDVAIAQNLDSIDWDFSGFVPSPSLIGIHRIHWYPAPFPPALAGTLLDILGQDGSQFLDPFCGSGVAPLEAWFRGKHVTAIDSNGFAIEICRAKVDLVTRATIKTARQLVESYKGFHLKSSASWKAMTPESICRSANFQPDAARWFSPKVLAEVAVIKEWIQKGGALPEAWARVLRITLSSLLHKQLSVVKNYHYTYIVDRSRVKEEARGWVNVSGIFSDKLVGDFTDGEQAREQVKRVNGVRDLQPLPEFRRGTAQESDKLVQGRLDLIITSPPYFGMNDYVRSQYLSWLIFQWNGYTEDIVAESGARRSRRSQRLLDAYYDDMAKAFRCMHGLLRRGGYLALVVGRSRTRLVQDHDPINKLMSLVLQAGFNLCWSTERRVRFRKINSIPYRTEILWVFQC